jgi:tetratricopeptide (TPR) repeat protein
MALRAQRLSELIPPARAAGRRVAGVGAPAGRRRRPLAWLLAPVLLGTPAAYAAKCTVVRMPDIPVTMSGLVPTMHAQINGADALFIPDSGSFFDFVAPAAVGQFHMSMDYSYRTPRVRGVGGVEQAQVARATTFTIFGQTVRNVPFLVAGEHFGGGAVGLIGQNLFRIADVEYDLANGVMRLVRPKDCKDTQLAYWASAANKPYSVVDIAFATAMQPHTRSVAYLNGTRIRVIFDTGTPRSTLTLEAAKRAGMTPASEGVVAGGPQGGIGPRVSQSWIARFANFKIGDEEIKHAQLRFGDLILDADMLIGADFFLSHRIYVASSQSKLYFTYNGGPVFDLATARATAQAADGATAAEAPAAAESSKPGLDPLLDQPTDAAGYARRGAASAARLDYASAIADLTRACELAPTEPGYFYERGVAHWYSGQLDPALADFDQALRLKPDHLDALLGRAALRARRHDPPDAVALDLGAADRAASRESDAHLRIGALYGYVDDPAAALAQYSKWIDSHAPDDGRMPGALNSRCWQRALLGQALDRALADCDTALKLRPHTAAFLDSRGLVHLRRGDYDKAIADYDAALHLEPKTAWSLYGRGLARLRKGLSAEGQADLAAATALQPTIAKRAARFGLNP